MINHFGDLEFHIELELKGIVWLIRCPTKTIGVLPWAAGLSRRIHCRVHGGLVFVFGMEAHSETVRRQQWPPFGITRENEESSVQNIFLRRHVLLEENPLAVFQFEICAVLEDSHICATKSLHHLA